MIAKNRKLYVGGYDLSGHLQGMEFGTSVEMQDDTVFGLNSRSSASGLDGFTIQHEGVWAAGAGLPDTIFNEHKGLTGLLSTVAPVDANEGSIAYFMRTSQGSYTTGGAVGDLLRFSVSLGTSLGTGAVRGMFMANRTITANGSGTARQLGAVGASGSLYAGLHVLSASGSSPTLNVTVQSDNASGFPSPETRLTFAQATGRSSQWATPVGGAIADDWWRVSWVIGGTDSPSFDAVVVIGIQ